MAVSRDKLMEQFMPRGEEGITAITWQDEVVYQSVEPDKSRSPEEYEIYSQDMANGFTIWNLASKQEIMKDSSRYLKSFVLWILVSLFVGILLALFYSRRRYVIFHNLVDHSAALEDERDALLAESCLYELLTLDLKKGDALWDKCLACGVHVDRKSQYIILFPKTVRNEALKEYFVGMKREDECLSLIHIFFICIRTFYWAGAVVNCREGTQKSGIRTVSYTHLDVYKRQAYSSDKTERYTEKNSGKAKKMFFH